MVCVPRALEQRCSGPFGARVLCQMTFSCVLSYDRLIETIERTIHTHTSKCKIHWNSTCGSRVARPTQRPRCPCRSCGSRPPESAGRSGFPRRPGRPPCGRVAMRAPPAAAAPVVCERSAGSRQKLPSSSNAGEAAACSGGTTSALARPFTHGLPAAARARLVFHAIGTRDAALNAGRSEQALRANSEFSGRTPDWC